MGNYLIPLSERQVALLRTLWGQGIPLRSIPPLLSVDLRPGEARVTYNAAITWRQKYDLPKRRAIAGTGPVFARDVDMNFKPMGRLPDPEIVARTFGDCRFEDAKVPAARGRIGPAGPTRVLQASSISLFEGMAS